MSAPLSTTRRAVGVAHLARAGRRLRRSWPIGSLLVAPHEFYRTLLDQSVRALSAVGGAVWLRAPAARCSQSRRSSWPRAEFAQRRSRAARTKRCLPMPRRTGASSASRRNRLSDDSAMRRIRPSTCLLLGPVQVVAATARNDARPSDHVRDHRAVAARRCEPGDVSRLRAIPHGGLRAGGRLSRVRRAAPPAARATTIAAELLRAGPRCAPPIESVGNGVRGGERRPPRWSAAIGSAC